MDNVPVRAGETVRTITSYGFNGSINGFGAGPPVPYSKLAKFKSSDIIIWELDEYFHTVGGGVNIFNDGSNFPHEGISPRHGMRSAKDTSTTAGKNSNAGAIISCAGMSVEWITVKDYYRIADDPNTTDKNRLWNSQFSRNGR